MFGQLGLISDPNIHLYCSDAQAYTTNLFYVLVNTDVSITKAYLYNFDPPKPNFYTVKLGLTGVYIIFRIFAQKHRLWVLVRTASARRF